MNNRRSYSPTAASRRERLAKLLQQRIQKPLLYPLSAEQQGLGLDPILGFFRTFRAQQFEQLAQNDDWRLMENDFLPTYHSLRKEAHQSAS